MRNQRFDPSQSGMTLVEVLVSFAIISILVMSFYSIFSQSAKQSTDEQYSDLALQIGRSVMDTLRDQVHRSDAVTIYGQSIPVMDWKSTNVSYPIQAPELYYPDIERKQFTILLQLERIGGQVELSLSPAQKPSLIPDENQSSNRSGSKERVGLPMDQFFRKLIVTVKDPNQREYAYEALITVQ